MSATRVDADFLRTRPLPTAKEGSKEHRGKVMIVCGSSELAGVPVLTGTAAMRSGAGTIQIATARSIAISCGVAVPEALVLALDETSAGGLIANDKLGPMISKSDAVVIGPGLVDGDAVVALLRHAIQAHSDGVIVIDAEPLKHLRQLRTALRGREGRIVLTPHAGEMAALLECERDDVEADPEAAARKAASLFGAIVVMKGSETAIVAPGGESWAYTEGTVGLATSGSGDVLAGIIGGLAARGASPADAAIWGVYLHGEAGRRIAARIGQVGLLARELAGELPRIMSAFEAP